MTVSPFALIAAAGLAGSGVLFASVPPSPAPSPYDAAFAVSAYGDQPLSAGPNAYSSSGRTSENVGGARSADGQLVVGWGHAAAGDGHADAVATDVSVLGGAVRATAVIAHCRHGAATSRAAGVVGEVNGEATIAYDVRSKNQDGSTTVVGMQIRVHSGHGTVINIASATCAPQQDQPRPPRPAAGLAEHTTNSSVVAGDRSRTQTSSFGAVTQTGTVPAGS
jgi:hypothetical protein